jgi:cell division transport system ATP-binding protein
VPPATQASEPQYQPQPAYSSEPEYEAPPAAEQTEPEREYEPAAASVAPSTADTGQTRLSAHFAAPPTQPVIRPRVTDQELPEQLSLAEKLGLRAPGRDDDEPGEQNVGPTK